MAWNRRSAIAQDDSARLSVLVKTAVDGIMVIDRMGTVLMFNPACERLFGYRSDEVVGQNVKMLMPEPFRGEHDQYLKNYRETGRRKIIGIGREVSGRRKDGATFPMDLSVGEAGQGSNTIFVGIIHDLTQRNRAEQEIRESTARLEAVVETAVDGVCLINASGKILMFNPACERLFGYQAHEVIGQNVKILMPQPHRDEHDGYLANYRRTGQRKVIGIGREVVGQRKDGTTFPMDLSVGEAKQESGESIYVGMIHDLTERKRTEEQLAQAQKMEAVGQLSGGIAHDFNNLLTIILGNAETLSEMLKSRPDLRHQADVISGAAERGAELTRRLLAFSRRQTLQPLEINCNKLIDGMQPLMRRALREDISIETALESELWPAYADKSQLESAILNLAVNAQDAMPGGGNLTVTTANMPLDTDYSAAHPEVRSGNYVMVAVTDDGTGMPPEILDRVFEPFFTTKEVGKGSGLGLSMVYGFVKQSNGHITIYSEPGLGTTVRIYLPAGRSAAASSPPIDYIGDEDPERGCEIVLLAEDDPFVRAYAVSTLEALGYHVVAATDGREALTYLAQLPRIDLLFTDIVMPGGLSGWELAEKAQDMRPGIKVLFTSGYALDTLAARGRVPPGALILNKPYRRKELAALLRKALLNA